MAEMTEEQENKEETEAEGSVSLDDDTLQLITNSTSLLLAIRHCAEKGMSPSDVHLALNAALDCVRPKSGENRDIFKEIESSLALIKAGCTPR
mmetsp:Transcript_3261/g.3950  ORF Transcript_3261/g.3950 Transcript_3261/m.3950 type:complete len:93 (-) Transcript_3261:954-1232(-)